MKKSGLVSILATIFTAIICVLMIIDSEGMINAAKNSVTVCLNIIIPSLFAFMVLSQIMVSSGMADILFYPFYKVSRFWFKGSKREFGIFMLSLIGGYPVGIKLLKEEIAYNKNFTAIAEKMLCYCYCGSPAFIIQTAGLSVLGSVKAGLIAYASNVLACFSAAAIMNVFSEKRAENSSASLLKAKITLQSITDSINGAVKSLGIICGTILAFNIVLELIRFSGIIGFFENLGIDKIFCAAFEISNISLFRGNDFALLPLFSALTSFGGLCIIIQTAALSKGSLPLKQFILWRIPVSALSAAYCFLLIRFFPIYVETEASAPIVPVLSSVNPICSVCLIIMTFILLNSVSKEHNKA